MARSLDMLIELRPWRVRLAIAALYALGLVRWLLPEHALWWLVARVHDFALRDLRMLPR